MQLTHMDQDFAVGPQIGLSDVAEIAAAGFTALINNRPDGESPDQPPSAAMEAEAKRHGLRYWYIPVSPAGITANDVRLLAQALAETDGPAFAYCRSGTRSGNLWRAARQDA